MLKPFTTLASRFLLLSIFALLSVKAAAQDILMPSPPAIAAKAYILMDANSGKVLVEKNADQLLEPASLTKMMTAYVVDHEIAAGTITADDITTISPNAWAQNPVFNGSSLMWLEAGKQVSVSDLLKGVIISSGNDATVALAEHLAGSEAAFVDLMNQQAKLLGMKNTYFENPHGLPAAQHQTTARDMALLAQAVIQDFPEAYKLYAEKSFTYNNIKQPNRNKLLWRDPSVDGLKTGYTKAAGYCLVASAKKADMRLISVVMGARSQESRAQESQKLLSYGFRFYETLKPYSKGDQLTTAKIYGGAQPEANIVAKADIYVTLPRSQRDQLEVRLEVEKYLQAPLKAQQAVGNIALVLGDTVLARESAVLAEAVESGGFFAQLWGKIVLFFTKLLN
ncbi:MAG: D-alanyl-D-alanine carboxypeptidase [Pseudomonadales bacterium]|nr:D-alanyl-D-alanine carboxypeptidase [Pseudomonadales bacterium]